MAKLRNDYETSRWARFLSWMKGESDALDKSAVRALGEKAHPNQRSEAEHAAIERPARNAPSRPFKTSASFRIICMSGQRQRARAL